MFQEKLNGIKEPQKEPKSKRMSSFLQEKVKDYLNHAKQEDNYNQ